MNNRHTLAMLFTIVMLTAATTVFATTRRVNNNTGITGSVYTTLQAAYDAATAGDTLILEGSNTSYGDLTLTKKLVIFGTGYLLTSNPQTQASLLTAKVDNITFNSGSAASVIMGCTINSITVNANDVIIARNYIQATSGNSISLNSATNIIIQQNIVWGMITNIAGKTPSVVIRNNLLGQIEFSSSITSALIINNVVTSEYYYCGYSINVNKSVIMNNIFKSTGWIGYPYNCYGGYVYFNETQENTITYNVFSQEQPSGYSGSNNQFSISMSTVFSPGTGNIDKNYIVTSGSVAETAGQGGSLCGMFGGDYPYVLSGMPPIPHIYKLDADPAGNNTNPLDVKISVKSQN